MSSAENPYAAPACDSEIASDDPTQVLAERTRQTHIRREALIRSCGFLYYFGAGCVAILLFWTVCRTNVPVRMLYEFVPRVFWLYVLLGVGAVLLLLTGWGLRRLAGWTMIPVAFFSVLGLFSFPVGTASNLVILYLVLGPKAWKVFSDEYREVIDRTPHIRYRAWRLVLFWCVFLASAAILHAITEAVK